MPGIRGEGLVRARGTDLTGAQKRIGDIVRCHRKKKKHSLTDGAGRRWTENN